MCWNYRRVCVCMFQNGGYCVLPLPCLWMFHSSRSGDKNVTLHFKRAVTQGSPDRNPVWRPLVCVDSFAHRVRPEAWQVRKNVRGSRTHNFKTRVISSWSIQINVSNTMIMIANWSKSLFHKVFHFIMSFSKLTTSQLSGNIIQHFLPGKTGPVLLSY